MRTILSAAACFLTLAPALLQGQVLAQPFLSFSTVDQDRLRAGEVLVWNDKVEKKRYVHAAVLLDHPVEQVWALLDNKEATPTFIASVKSAQVVSRENNVCVISQETEAPGTGRTFRYLIQHTLTYPQRVDFVRLSGDLRQIEGCWFFDPIEEGKKTLLVYDLHLDAGMLVPQGFIVGSQMKSLPVIMTSIRSTLAAQTWPPVASTPALVPGQASATVPSLPASAPGLTPPVASAPAGMPSRAALP